MTAADAGERQALHSPGTAGTTLLAVAGAHLIGQPMHPFLLGLGARYQRTTRTAPVYRMIALPAVRDAAGAVVVPPRPGLFRGAAGGGAIEVEVYRLPVPALGNLIVTVPPPLAIGTVLLADGAQVPGFVCEGYARETGPDVTQLGSWRSYLSSLGDSAAGRPTP
jgi:allophanate hydrolase